VLRGVEHVDGEVLQQFFLGRQITPLQVARIVDHDIRVTYGRANRGERLGYGGVRHQVQLDNHTFAALRADGLLQRRRIGGTPGR
jgi:hypothetical protein